MAITTVLTSVEVALASFAVAVAVHVRSASTFAPIEIVTLQTRLVLNDIGIATLAA